MAAGNHMRLHSETLARDALLKIERKEPVVRRGDHVDRYLGPALETARFLEDRLRLITRARGARPERGLRHVVQKVGRDVERCTVSPRLRGRHPGISRSCVLPPSPRLLAG